jgi:hypothetical protein
MILNDLPSNALFIFNILFIAFMLSMIEVIKKYNPNLLGVFGFISGTFFFIQLLQYYYIKHRANTQVTSFLKHTCVGYAFSVFMALLFLYFIEYTNIEDIYVLYGFGIFNIMVCMIYVCYFKNVF